MTKWVTKKLGEICEKITDGSHDSPKPVDDGYYMPSVKDMRHDNFDFSDCKQISKNDFERLKGTGCKPEIGDVLIAKDGSILKYCFVVEQDLPIVILSSIAILRPDKSIIDGKFLSYYFQKEDVVTDVVENYKSGTGVPRIVLRNFEQIEIPYPESLAEQRRIAGILSSADGAIAASEALIAKYRNIKRGLLTTLLQPKEGWKKVKLGECLKQKPDYGINAPAVAYDNNLPTYLRITDITEDGYYSKNDVVSVADPDAYKYKMEEGDLVFARTGASVGKTYLYNPQDGILVFAGFLIRVKTDENILLSSFFKYQTQTQQYKNWIANNSMRTGQPGINGNEYETFSFYLPYKNGQPDLTEQRRIAEILSSVDAKIAAEEMVVEKYKGVKKGLMEEMMKGNDCPKKNLE